MIVKILTRHSPSYASLIKYILKEGKGSEVITHNLRSDNQEGYVKEFLENEALRKHQRTGSVYMYHEIISLSAKEDNTKITDSMLKNLAQKYISLRGKNGIYVGAVHRDEDHIHIHFCSGGTEFRTGKAFRLSKQKLQNLKIKFQEYHQKKFPELTKSTANHGAGKEYVKNKEWQLQHRDERKSVKEQICQTVTDCFAKAKSQKEFLESLRGNGLHYYERNGIPTGIESGIKIRFSRLGITKEQFNGLPIDRTEEDKALQVIAKLREQTINKNKTHQYER